MAGENEEGRMGGNGAIFRGKEQRVGSLGGVRANLKRIFFSLFFKNFLNF